MSESSLSKRNILVGITGSVAAYKACDLVRRLTEAGAEVRIVMTENARRFLGETTLAALSGNRVVTGLFTGAEDWMPQHISLGRWAEAVVIAPATANIIGKAAAGIADDILSTIILSASCVVVFAPAMNTAMYEHVIVQENIAKLRRAGCEFVEPEAGILACGEEGVGRLASTDAILEKLKSILQPKG